MAKHGDILRALAQNTEEKILLSHIAEQAEVCRMRGYPTDTHFLDLHEAELARRLLTAMGESGGRFWGGYPDAERQIVLFLPDWMDELPQDGEDCPLTAIRCLRRKEDVLTHRDYLGSLMGLGVRRDSIGDILVGDHGADIVVQRAVAPYLLANFGRAGRKRLTVEEISLAALMIPEEDVIFLRDTVASMRLDAIAAAMFRLPRARAAEAVRAGRVFLNHMECRRPDQPVAVHDRITLRGMGRGEVDGILGESRKGRIAVSLKRSR